MFFNSKLFVGVMGVILLNIFLPTQAQIDLNGVGILHVVGEKQYFIQKALKVNFYKALQYCAQLDMTLASIESATEQDNLKKALFANSNLSQQYWLSGNDLAVNKELVWFGTGSLFSYTSWAPGVRNNNAHRCIRTDSNFNWRRDSCFSSQYFICEKPVVPVCGPQGECINAPFIYF